MPTDESLESNAIYRYTRAVFARTSRTGEVVEDHGVLIASAGVDWPGMNLAFLQSPVTSASDLAARAEFARRFFAERGRVWLFILYDEWAGPCVDTRTALASAGVLYAQDAAGMIADRIAPVRRELPDLEYRLVDDARSAYDLAAINAEANGVPVGWAVETVGSGPHWNPPVRAWVAYEDGKAVATAMTRPARETLWAGWVATRPDYQRRGCGEAAMRHALAGGFSRSALEATPAGVALYERLGYRRVARFEVYVGGRSSQPSAVVHR